MPSRPPRAAAASLPHACPRSPGRRSASHWPAAVGWRTRTCRRSAQPLSRSPARHAGVNDGSDEFSTRVGADPVGDKRTAREPNGCHDSHARGPRCPRRRARSRRRRSPLCGPLVTRLAVGERAASNHETGCRRGGEVGPHAAENVPQSRRAARRVAVRAWQYSHAASSHAPARRVGRARLRGRACAAARDEEEGARRTRKPQAKVGRESDGAHSNRGALSRCPKSDTQNRAGVVPRPRALDESRTGGARAARANPTTARMSRAGRRVVAASVTAAAPRKAGAADRR